MAEKSLTHNTLWNLGGQGFTLIIAFFATPAIIHGMGTERFGIFTLLIAIIYYFTFFDFGLGYALTHLLSKEIEKGSNPERLIPLIWTTLFFLLGIGILIILAFLLFAPFVFKYWFNIPPHLQPETFRSLFYFIWIIPLILVNSGMKGVLNAHHRFDLVNMIEIPISALRFLLPLIMLFFSNKLTFMILALIIAQILSTIAYFIVMNYLVPLIKSRIRFTFASMKALFYFGGWLSISQFIGPIMVYFDRFLLGILTSMRSVAYYTTPYDVITKLWFIPGSVATPLFAKVSSKHQMIISEIRDIYIRGLKYVFILVFPIILLVVSFAKEGLQGWLGLEFAQNSTKILQWLSIGILINSLAQISINLIIGMGRPDLSAKLHLIELPVYLITLWILITIFGALGAAMAWVARVTIDGIILFLISTRLVNIKLKNSLNACPAILISSFFLFILPLVPIPILKAILSIPILLILIIFYWWIVLTPEERIGLKRILKQNE